MSNMILYDFNMREKLCVFVWMCVYVCLKLHPTMQF